MKKSKFIYKYNWQGKVSNYRQLGGIETSVLENGISKGVRIAWINTGSGLQIKVVLDRGMDIAEALYNEHSLTWLSHSGIMPPDPTTVSGMNWLRTFGGGLLNTCGLTHTGAPEDDKYGERGLHDRINHYPAYVESIIQPDIHKKKFEMSITGKMMQSVVFGHHLELKRTISAKLGIPVIKIHDEVINLGNQPAPHMILYHINFGWPLIDEGTKLIWEGEYFPREVNDLVFNESGNFKTCKSPIAEHSGTGESVAFIKPLADEKGIIQYEVFNPKLPLRIQVRYKKEQLPWLTNWQHWGVNEYVTALEPGTHPPIGQSTARRDGSLIFIQPGEVRIYDLELKVVQNKQI